MRVAILWPRDAALVPQADAIPAARTDLPAPAIPVPVPPVPIALAFTSTPATAHIPPARGQRIAGPPLVMVPSPSPNAAPLAETVPGQTPAPETQVFASFPAQSAFPPSPDRWSASGWLMLRQGGSPGVAPGGQLGGSQAGVRLVYMLAPKRRVAAFARVVTPLSGRGREATLGVEWQPSRVPVRIVAEQRFAIDGGNGGPGLGLVGGLDRAVMGFRLETYGQAGAIRRARIEPYADGAARVTRRLGHGLAIGAGMWGAAQRDAARFDVGPSATLTVPVARHSFRLALDWRQRVAGDARPGSGVALSLGSDF